MSHEKFRTVIDACYEAAMFSDHCAIACLESNQVNPMKECIEINIYCAEICRTAARFMSMGTFFIDEIVNLCAAICEKCALESAKHPNDYCQRSAAACKACVEAFRSVTAVA